MKKLFVVALAAIGMMACVQENVTELPNGGEISFGKSFINNSTRAALDPSYTVSTLDKFNVWGYVEQPEGTVFQGTEVTNNNGVGTYTDTQYWAPEKDYYFAAVAGVAADKVTTTAGTKPTAIAFENVAGTQDLLFAAKYVKSAPAGQDNAKVELEFDHILSKVKFSFTNAFPTSNVSVKVVDITMNAVKSATYELGEWVNNGGIYNIENAAWKDLSTESVMLDFGATETIAAPTTPAVECANERLLIPTPATQEYTISFTIKVYNGTVEVNSVEKTSKIKGVSFEQGKAYNLTAEITPESLGMDAIEFTVKVNDWEESNVAWNENTYYVGNAAELQAALNAAVGISTAQSRAAYSPVPTTIYFTKDITGNVTITEADEAPYHKITIDGCGKKYDGQMSIYGNSSEGKGTLLIKDINFETETEKREFIWCADSSNGSYWRYANNVTIEGCTFTAKDGSAALHTAVGAKFQQCYNITLIDCVATNMHSLLQAESCGSAVTVKGSKVVNGKNGVSFNNTKVATISDTEIEAVGEGSYGIRHKGQQAGYALTVENCNVKAFAPVLVRNMTAQEYTLTFKGTNVLTNDNVYGMDVVISAGDYDNDAALPTAPTGNCTIVGEVKDYVVFPQDILKQDVAALKEALAEGGFIALGADVLADEPLNITKDVTIDLQGNTIGAALAKVDGVSVINIAEGATLTIENGTIESTTVNGAAAIINNGNLVLGEGAKVVGAPISDGGYPEYAIVGAGEVIVEEGATLSSDRGVFRLNDGANVTINGGDIYVTDALGTRSLTSHVICAYDGAKVTINGGNITSYYPNATDNGSSVICPWGGDIDVYGGNFTYVGKTGQGGCFQNYMGAGSKVNVYGGTYSDASVKEWLADGYYAKEKDGKYIVLPNGVDAQVTSGSELSSAIVAGDSNVMLEADVTYNTAIKNDANINLNGNTFEAAGTIELGNNADLTMVGGNYEVNGTYGHVDVRPSTAEGSVVVFEGVDFSFNKLNKTYGPSTNRLGSVVEVCGTVAGAHTKILFKGCTFDNAQVLFEGMSGKTGTFEALFEDCTFNALTSSAPIYVQNYVEGTIEVKGCTFNLECTSSTASAISISSSTSTSVTLIAENNTLNAVAATPSGVADTVEQVKVNGTPKDIKFVSAGSNSTLNVTNTTATGIAAK